MAGRAKAHAWARRSKIPAGKFRRVQSERKFSGIQGENPVQFCASSKKLLGDEESEVAHAPQ
ncbi:MAG: hypothetical protein PHW13_05665 [Methylococcales bacterium]|nr:hypothetical protein [Methylococcales bacterium]